MSSRDGLSRALAAMSAQMHGLALDQHSVTSPLGLWLLLATAGSTAEAEGADELRRVLGLPVEEAADLARSLLARPHTSVMSALAVWADPEFTTQGFLEWADALAGPAEVGVLPTQSAADAWAQEKTDGLIQRFPAQIDPDTMLLLASALATRVTWAEPFELATAATAPGMWSTAVTTVLQAPEETRRFIVGDRLSGMGDVAVHEARSAGMAVISVAAHPDQERGKVLRAAHRIAAAMVPAWASNEDLDVRSLFDLELGAHPCWDLSEESGVVYSDNGREEIIEAFLPAWEVKTHVDLGDASGVGVVAEALFRLLRPHPQGSAFGATQAARAEYTRTGFSAAAVTTMIMAGSGPPEPRPGTIRTAALHFDLPHAVVATALDERGLEESAADPDPWEGLPVFSAWITKAVDAT